MEESDNKKESNDERSPTITPKSKTISYKCKICGSPALHSNYGAITCYPCKIFFKRNSTIESKQSTCIFNGQCEINAINRHICSACRLAKCFANGMQVDLIRCPLSKTNLTSKTLNNTTTSAQDQLQLFPTTNLLQSNTSVLTANQWTLLSNLISSYNERKLISIAQEFLNDTHDLTLSEEFFLKIYETTGIYIRSNEDFCTLSSDDRSIFLRNIAENVTCLGLILIWNQSQIYNSKSFINIYIDFYGEHSLMMIQRVSKFIDPDLLVAKLALSLFAFSNNSSIFFSNMTIRPLNTLAIFQIQNIYAEIIWKYLLHEYGYYQSIKRFINLIQCLLVATNTVFDAQNNDKHINDIQTLIEQTELTLILSDIECIDQKKNSLFQ